MEPEFVDLPRAGDLSLLHLSRPLFIHQSPPFVPRPLTCPVLSSRKTFDYQWTQSLTAQPLSRSSIHSVRCCFQVYVYLYLWRSKINIAEKPREEEQWWELMMRKQKNRQSKLLLLICHYFLCQFPSSCYYRCAFRSSSAYCTDCALGWLTPVKQDRDWNMCQILEVRYCLYIQSRHTTKNRGFTLLSQLKCLSWKRKVSQPTNDDTNPCLVS